MPNPYVVGNVIRLTATFKDSTGRLADPSGVTFTVLCPDGTSSQIVGTQDSTGVWHADYTISQHGQHHYRAEGAGALVAASEQRFDVPYSPFTG